MKKLLRNQKGFSMIELLVALLIMAVIAGIAIALFGNIVGQTKENADAESAQQIKKQLLYYINQTNDSDLSCLISTGQASVITSANDLVDRLGGVLTITQSAGSTTYSGNTNVPRASALAKTWTGPVTAGETLGTFGPYLDGTKSLRPQANGTYQWYIDINDLTQEINVSTTLSSVSNSINVSH